MPDFRRAFAPGGTFFFTVVTEERAELFNSENARKILRGTIEDCLKTRPFELEAMVLLPDHLHAIWTLPDSDSNYSIRWASIKANFTRVWLQEGGFEQHRSGSRIAGRRRGVWQRQFLEHLIKDQDDYRQHLDYVHYNPVKHGLASCPHEWPYSTFPKWIKRGVYSEDWQCVCDQRKPLPLSLPAIDTNLE